MTKLNLKINKNKNKNKLAGNKVVTDVTANDGTWTFLCAVWSSGEGYWAVYQDAMLADEGKGLSKGETIMGKLFCILTVHEKSDVQKNKDFN